MDAYSTGSSNGQPYLSPPHSGESTSGGSSNHWPSPPADFELGQDGWDFNGLMGLDGGKTAGDDYDASLAALLNGSAEQAVQHSATTPAFLFSTQPQSHNGIPSFTVGNYHQAPAVTPMPRANPEMFAGSMPGSVMFAPQPQAPSVLANAIRQVQPQQQIPTGMQPHPNQAQLMVQAQQQNAAPRRAAAAPSAFGGNTVDLIANAGMSTRRGSVPVLNIKAESDKSLSPPPVQTGKRKASAADMDDDDDDDGPPTANGHNAVERRYRNKINTSICDLKDEIPALSHLKDPAGVSPTHRRKSSAFVLSTQHRVPAGTIVDGVEAAQKLSKGVVLNKSLEYIRFLKYERATLRAQQEATLELLSQLPGANGPMFIQALQQRWHEIQEQFEARRAVEDEEYGMPARPAAKNRRTSNGKRTAVREEASPPQPMAPMPPMSSAVYQANVAAFAPGNAQQYFDALNSMRVQPQPQQQQQQQPTDTMFGNYDMATSALAYAPQQFAADPRQSRSPTSHSPPGRMLLAMFAGVSFVGGVGYDWSFSSTKGANEGPSRAWNLSRRADATASIPAAAAPLAASSPLGTGFAFLGAALSILGVAIFVWPYVAGLYSTPQSPRVKRRRSEALAMLSGGSLSPEAHDAETLRQARQSYAALLILADAPSTLFSSAVAYIVQSLLNFVGFGAFGFNDLPRDEQIERAVALVRLVEFESAYGSKLGYWTQRLWSLSRLLALSRSSTWQEIATPSAPAQLNLARVQATLSLQYVSLFGGRASTISNRRRLWTSATMEPKKDDDSTMTSPRLEPWVEVALAADFEQAAQVVSQPRLHTMIPSPSDSLPLLRLAETRCEAALVRIWYSLFSAITKATSLDESTDNTPTLAQPATLTSSLSVPDREELNARIESIVQASVVGSPVYTLALLTRGVFCIGVGDSNRARDIAFKLALEARDGGPASRLASAHSFVRLVLAPHQGSTKSLVGAADAQSDIDGRVEPIGEVDAIATLALRWLLLRTRAQRQLDLEAAATGDKETDVEEEHEDDDGETASQESENTKTDRNLYEATLSLRVLFANPAFHPVEGDKQDVEVFKTFSAAQQDCMDAIVALGRRAAGLA